MEYIEISAKTVNDAITEACQKFTVTSDKLDYVVVEEGSSGFLGIGAKLAVIKAKVKGSIEDKAKDFLKEVFDAMDMVVVIDAKYDEENKVIYIPGVRTKIYDTRLTTFYNPRAFNQIRKWKLDIIHSQTEFGVGTFARIIAKQFDIPLIHTYHTMYEDYIHYITKGYFDKSSKKIVEYLTLFYCDKTANELIVPTKKTYDLFKEKTVYNVHGDAYERV